MLLKYKSPIGIIYCLFKGSELIATSIGEKSLYIKEFSEDTDLLKGTFKNELDAYFNGDLKEFNQKIKFIIGTDFEHKVWLALKQIPYGETRSYKWIAKNINCPKAVRAVGQALRKNPLPVILPCHRVIASNGSIGGFSCGVEIKKWLLRHEGVLNHV